MAVNRRPRRRPGRWLFAAVLVTVVVLLANAALRSHPSQAENVLGYLDQVRPAIQSSSDQGADLADVRANAATLGRVGVARRLDRLVSQSKTTVNVVSALSPPAALRVAHAYLLAAMGVRAKAIADARQGMAAALAEGPVDPAMQGLVAAGQEMQLGDQAYGLFTGSLPAGTVPPPPASTWVADPSVWGSAQVSAFVSTLRSSTSLTPVNDVAVVTFTTIPPPVGSDNGMVVFPPTKGMQVSIVVANVGNQPVKHATVSATLHTDVVNTSETVRDFVDLAPGQEAALTIGSLHPTSGTTGSLTVTISTVTGETNVANNTQQEAVELR